MKINEWPDTILKPHTITKLLQAMKAGVIEMNEFPEIYFPPHSNEDQIDRSSRVTPDEVSQFNAIRAKIRYHTTGHLPLTRSLKLRLLNAIRMGRINGRADFPELIDAYGMIDQDWSAISPEERHMLGDICRKITAA